MENEDEDGIKNYDLGQLIGKGGFASVYRARARQTGKEVAIKIMEKETIKYLGVVDRVKNEIEIQWKLQHPCIIELYVRPPTTVNPRPIRISPQLQPHFHHPQYGQLRPRRRVRVQLGSPFTHPTQPINPPCHSPHSLAPPSADCMGTAPRSIQSFFEDDSNVYMVMELCPRGDLFKHVRRCPGGYLSESEAVPLFEQLLLALRHLHALGVVHRDVKLSNLLLIGPRDDSTETHSAVSESLQLKLADFGLSVQLEHDDEERFTLCGTPNYIAPEIAGLTTRSGLMGVSLDSGGHGRAVDIWAAGCTLYLLLLGRPPFQGRKISETLANVAARRFSVPLLLHPTETCLDDLPGLEGGNQFSPTISAEARDLLLCLLTTKPEDRISLDAALEHPLLLRHRELRRQKSICGGVASTRGRREFSSIGGAINDAVVGEDARSGSRDPRGGDMQSAGLRGNHVMASMAPTAPSYLHSSSSHNHGSSFVATAAATTVAAPTSSFSIPFSIEEKEGDSLGAVGERCASDSSEPSAIVDTYLDYRALLRHRSVPRPEDSAVHSTEDARSSVCAALPQHRRAGRPPQATDGLPLSPAPEAYSAALPITPPSRRLQRARRTELPVVVVGSTGASELLEHERKLGALDGQRDCSAVGAAPPESAESLALLDALPVLVPPLAASITSSSPDHRGLKLLSANGGLGGSARVGGGTRGFRLEPIVTEGLSPVSLRTPLCSLQLLPPPNNDGGSFGGGRHSNCGGNDTNIGGVRSSAFSVASSDSSGGWSMAASGAGDCVGDCVGCWPECCPSSVAMPCSAAALESRLAAAVTGAESCGLGCFRCGGFSGGRRSSGALRIRFFDRQSASTGASDLSSTSDAGVHSSELIEVAMEIGGGGRRISIVFVAEKESLIEAHDQLDSAGGGDRGSLISRSTCCGAWHGVRLRTPGQVNQRCVRLRLRLRDLEQHPRLRERYVYVARLLSALRARSPSLRASLELRWEQGPVLPLGTPSTASLPLPRTSAGSCEPPFPFPRRATCRLMSNEPLPDFELSFTLPSDEASKSELDSAEVVNGPFIRTLVRYRLSKNALRVTQQYCAAPPACGVAVLNVQASDARVVSAGGVSIGGTAAPLLQGLMDVRFGSGNDSVSVGKLAAELGSARTLPLRWPTGATSGPVGVAREWWVEWRWSLLLLTQAALDRCLEMQKDRHNLLSRRRGCSAENERVGRSTVDGVLVLSSRLPVPRHRRGLDVCSFAIAYGDAAEKNRFYEQQKRVACYDGGPLMEIERLSRSAPAFAMASTPRLSEKDKAAELGAYPISVGLWSSGKRFDVAKESEATDTVYSGDLDAEFFASTYLAGQESTNICGPGCD